MCRGGHQCLWQVSSFVGVVKLSFEELAVRRIKNWELWLQILINKNTFYFLGKLFGSFCPTMAKQLFVKIGRNSTKRVLARWFNNHMSDSCNVLYILMWKMMWKWFLFYHFDLKSKFAVQLRTIMNYYESLGLFYWVVNGFFLQID